MEAALAKSGIQEGMILVSAMHITAGVWVNDAIAGAAQAAEAEEAATQLLYRFPAKVTVSTGHTVMVPFVDRHVRAGR